MEELKLENKKIIMQQFFENVGGSRLLDWLEEVGYYTCLLYTSDAADDLKRVLVVVLWSMVGVNL